MNRTFLRDGLPLAVQEAGDGRPVLLQHGLGGDAKQTAEAWPAPPGWRRVTLECRGHGASPPGPASFEAFAEDLAALAATLGPPVVLGGISMGAALSLRLAITHPRLVRALILIRPAWIADAAPPNLAPVREAAALLRGHPPDEARAAFLATDIARRLAEESPDNLASLLGYFDVPREGRADLLAAIAADHPGVSEAQIAALGLPTLVLGTPDDAIHPIAMARGLADLVPGARFVELPSKSRARLAHFAALHAAIADFLKDL